MTTSVSVEQTIRRAIAWGDHVRGPKYRLNDVGGHKEWLHFCIASDDLDLLVNFSLAEDLGPSAGERPAVARLLCVARTDDWDGSIEHFDEHDVQVDRGHVGLRFGDSSVRYQRGVFHVVAKMKTRPIELDVEFRPTCLPSMVNDIQLSKGPPSHWFLLPRLLATGHARIAGREVSFEDRPAYHDHNWGYFRWGDDFAWVWGYGHVDSRAGAWTATFDRLTNRARTVDFVRGIVLWRGARQERVFAGRDVTVRERGFLRPKSVLRLPRAMALLAGGEATDVPETLHIHARSARDALDMEFRSRHVCRILVPDEVESTTTVINEVSGELALQGCVRGQQVEGRGHAMFEFLRA